MEFFMNFNGDIKDNRIEKKRKLILDFLKSKTTKGKKNQNLSNQR
jgi:hypothetical protein